MNKTYLVHHGIKGQRWGVRRYQNNDGTLTAAGKRKYDVNADGTTRLKTSYIKGQNNRGIVKSALGTALTLKGINGVNRAKASGINLSSKDGKKALSGSIFNTILGVALVTSAATNFVNSLKDKSFNTKGMGATPETYTGPKKKK